MAILGVKNAHPFLQCCGGVTNSLRCGMINQTFDDSFNEYQIKKKCAFVFHYVFEKRKLQFMMISSFP